MSIYDDPELKTGNFVQWENVGDSVTADVIEVRKGRDFNGGVCPELVLRYDDGTDHVLTCGQANLKHQILELKPMPGDRIRVEFASTTKVEKGTRKDFKVDVKTGGAKGTAASAVAVEDEEPF